MFIYLSGGFDLGLNIVIGFLGLHIKRSKNWLFGGFQGDNFGTLPEDILPWVDVWSSDFLLGVTDISVSEDGRNSSGCCNCRAIESGVLG